MRGKVAGAMCSLVAHCARARGNWRVATTFVLRDGLKQCAWESASRANFKTNFKKTSGFIGFVAAVTTSVLNTPLRTAQFFAKTLRFYQVGTNYSALATTFVVRAHAT